MNGKVAVYVAPGEPFEFREYTVPDPAPDAILVRLRVCNICGSELHLWRGHVTALKKNQILGHEMVGTVEKLGRNVRYDSLQRPLKEGDRIIYNYSRPCGRCHYCTTKQAYCPHRNEHWIGVTSDVPPHFNGGFGEFYYLHAGQSVFRVPDALCDDLVSPVNCAGAQVYDGLRQIDVKTGESVVIQGAGGLGLYAVAIAREMGAGQIIVLDASPARLDLARRFGADQLLNVTETSVDERDARVREWTSGVGADVALELAGLPEVIAEGVALLRNGGRYLVMGNIGSERKSVLDPSQIVRKALTIRGLHGYEPDTIATVLDLLERTRTRYPYESIVSHNFRFEEINEAFAVAAGGEAIRVSLSFS